MPQKKFKESRNKFLIQFKSNIYRHFEADMKKNVFRMHMERATGSYTCKVCRKVQSWNWDEWRWRRKIYYKRKSTERFNL